MRRLRYGDPLVRVEHGPPPAVFSFAVGLILFTQAREEATM